MLTSNYALQFVSYPMQVRCASLSFDDIDFSCQGLGKIGQTRSGDAPGCACCTKTVSVGEIPLCLVNCIR